jgi:O-antigen ligase
MSNDSLSSKPNPPPTLGWLAPITALIPIFPPFYLLVLGSLKFWRQIPSVGRLVFWIFFVLQMVAALFTPDPMFSLICGALRAVLIAALLCAGSFLQSTKFLQPILWGEVITMLIAFGTTFWRHGWETFSVRLEHPIYISVSLGIMAMVGFFIALLGEKVDSRLRWAALSINFFALIFSGTRSALVATLGGLLLAALISKKPRAWKHFSFSTVAIFGISWLFSSGLLGFVSASLGRLTNAGLDPNGRMQVWKEAWHSFTLHPIGGVGTYQIGPSIPSMLQPCRIFPPVEPFGPCPSWLEKMNGAWNLAHNVLLHALTETGVIGAIGWMLLLGFLGWSAWKSKNPLLISLYGGYMAINMVDNPTLLPSPHVAEVFYVAMGMAIVQAEQTQAARGLSDVVPSQEAL